MAEFASAIPLPGTRISETYALVSPVPRRLSSFARAARSCYVAHVQRREARRTGADAMPGNSIKNKKTYKALKRKGMSKTRAAKIANAGKSASRRGGRKGGKSRKKSS
jgi:hypothetical protein